MKSAIANRQSAIHFHHLGRPWQLKQRNRGKPPRPWYFRLHSGRVDVSLCLRHQTTGEPLSLADALAAAKQAIEEHFRGPDQFARLREAVRLRSNLTVGKILEDYRAGGCPDRRGRPRQARALEAEKANIEALLEWWTPRNPAQITDRLRDDYWAKRRTTVKKGTGDRTTELELTTLNNALQWAWRRGDLKEMPRSLKTTYRDTAAIAHARDAMPGSGDELHAIASTLFNTPGGALYAWATLLAAFTGLRAGELALLRAHPQRHGVHVEPGWYDDRALVVPRTKRRAGKSRQDEFLLNDASRPHVRPLLDMIRAWHAATYPQTEEHLLPLSDGALTKHLQAVATRLGLPERQAHGLRAYYATARLAAGISAPQVAHELGHLGSGDELVRTIYGDTPPQWRGLENVYTWIPTTKDAKPAWTWWTDRATANIVNLR